MVFVAGDLHIISMGFGCGDLWGGAHVSVMVDIFMDFHFAVGAPRHQILAALLVSGRCRASITHVSCGV